MDSVSVAAVTTAFVVMLFGGVAPLLAAVWLNRRDSTCGSPEPEQRNAR